jgi:D-3-phosphoglycerate dehydrogenase / 2-oxoglutarate reductase
LTEVSRKQGGLRSVDDRLVYLKDSKSLLEVPAAVELLRAHGMTPVTNVPAERRSDVVAVIVGLGRFQPNDVNDFPAVRTVARFGAGYDNVDVDGLWSSRRINVSYTPDVSTAEVAEMTLAMMILTLRGIPRDVSGLSSNPTQWRVITRGISLSNATVGIVGCGNIGLAAAGLIAPLAARTLLWNRSGRPVSLRGVGEDRYEQVETLDELAVRSDGISIHLALTPESEGMIGPAFFNKLEVAGRSIALVNTARGNIVDERALLEALSSRVVRDAAIDVWSSEGRPADASAADTVGLLRRHPAVLPTSHIGAFTYGVLQRCAMQCAQNIVAAIDGTVGGFFASPADRGGR